MPRCVAALGRLGWLVAFRGVGQMGWNYRPIERLVGHESHLIAIVGLVSVSENVTGGVVGLVVIPPPFIACVEMIMSLCQNLLIFISR